MLLIKVKRTVCGLSNVSSGFCCRQIGAQTNIIMLAGYETTSVTLTYCIYLLSKHPQVQQRLRQEVDQFKGQPSYEQLDQFPYAAAVLKEALRLYPPAPFVARVAQEDTQVPHLGLDMPSHGV